MLHSYSITDAEKKGSMGGLLLLRHVMRDKVRKSSL